MFEVRAISHRGRGAPLLVATTILAASEALKARVGREHIAYATDPAYPGCGHCGRRWYGLCYRAGGLQAVTGGLYTLGGAMFVCFTRLDGRVVTVNASRVAFITDISDGHPFAEALGERAAAGCELWFGDDLSLPVRETREEVESQLSTAILAHAAVCGGN